ncbi:MAG TPA: LysR family transcriptional regulator [Candidatus Anaerostipes avistercoris]|mgnify:CR=1 FL=1|uniref:LysR family transcriptional regulator n=1 Tax=Candidatus Anaerostipes avistercoris TaxID=2838462 RepID=A0A9D2T8D2_9FIRM|nr:LysR family transcriptional regulator [Candidatus Anaerostipes avistercoris]
MEIRVLRYFLTVVREESISAAADYLHITQPTLSRQIKELEDELGVKLLNRGKKNRKITLTDEGMLLRKRAEEIVTLADKTRAEFDAAEEIISGDIYIGGGETEAMRLIARAAKKLQDSYPHIKYHLFSGNADDVAERLDKGLLDFGVFIEPANMEKYDYLRLPVTDTWGLLMRKDSSLASLNNIEVKNLKEIPLIVSRQSMTSNEFSGWGRFDFNQLNIVATYNLVYNASLLVAEGLGYALCLDRLVDTTDSSELCFRPLKPHLEARLNLVWKKYQIFSKAGEKFLEKLQEEFHG